MRLRVPPLLLPVVAVGVTAGHLAARVPLLSSRRFDPDEFEHAHMAWYILQGQIPYRDFFEHHTPLFHYLLAAYLSLFDVGGSPDQAMQALFGARYVAWALSGVIVAVTFVLARRLRDTTTAWVSLPIVSGGVVLALRAIEIRPDGLSTILWLCSLIALHAGLTSDNPTRRRTRVLFAVSGLTIGLAVLTSQKLLLAGPPIALIALWYVSSPRFGGARGDRLTNAAWQAIGVLATWSLLLAYFGAKDAAGDLLRLTVFEGVRWKPETTATTVLGFVVRYEPWLFALTAGGVVTLLRERSRLHRTRTSSVFLLLAGCGMFLGLFVVPVPYPQFCLTFLPLFAIIAATFLVEGARALSAGDRRWGALYPSGVTRSVLLLVLVLSLIGLSVAKPTLGAAFVYPVLVSGAVLSVVFLPFYRKPELALTVTVLVLSVFPAQWTRWMLELGDQRQYSELRYVLEHTPREGMVLDGFTGYGVFRRHAGYYWMFHPGVRAMIAPEAVESLVQDLRAKRIEPDVVVLDRNLRLLSPDLLAFIEGHYQAAGRGDIYLPAAR